MNVIEIFAKFIVDTDDLDKGLNEAEKKAEGAGSRVGGALSGIGNGLLAIGKTGVAAIGATATATGALAKQATDAYAEFQQLEGGIQTLFGEDISATVLENAANAYQTAGMSANDYMNTVINMAASLNKATGDTVESARLADVAITDMADNVNKMGTSMESVQNAYRGFTRGNFTMLDNLALGFAGTKDGMQELLDSAEAISGVKYDIDSYADIVNAIHVVQTEMGITGTTAKEAGDTISGSAGSMKAAWDNLVLGIAQSNSDLGQLITNFVASAEVMLKNMIPIFTSAIQGVGQLVQEAIPIINRELFGLVDEILPTLLESATILLDNLVQALPQLLQILTNILPMLLQSISDVMSENLPILTQAMIDMMVQLADVVVDMMPTLVDQFILLVSQIALVLSRQENVRAIIQAAKKLITALAKGLWDNRKLIFDTMRNVAKSITSALAEELPQIRIVFDALQKVIDGVFGFIEKHGSGIESVLKGILTGFLAYKAVTGVFDAISGAITAVQTAMTVMNGLMSAAAMINPYTAIAVSIGAVVGVMTTLIDLEQKENEAYILSITTLTEEEQRRLDVANEYIGKLDEIYGRNRDIVGSVEDETRPQQELLDELNKIVDANGRIKKGYEERADVIVTQLNDAFGTEMKLQNGVIQNYDTEMAKIDQLIEKKKAEALIDANKDAYAQALKDQIDLYNNMSAAQDEYNAKEFERAQAVKALERYERQMNDALERGSGSAGTYGAKMQEMANIIYECDLYLESHRDSLLESQRAYYAGQDFIEDYNKLLEGSANNTEDLTKAVENMTNGIIENAPDEILEEQAIRTMSYLDDLLDKQAKGVRITERQIEEAVASAEGAVEAMRKAGLDGADAYEESLEELVNKARSWGMDMVSEFTDGINNQSSRLSHAVDSMANIVRSRLHFSEPDVGPLADFSSYAPDMMDLFAQGVTQNTRKVTDAVENAFDFENLIKSPRGDISGVTGANSGLITPTAGRDVTVILQLNEDQLGKATFRLYNDESQRIGVDLGKEVVS